MEYINEMLEFNKIIEMLKEYASTKAAQIKFEKMAPLLDEKEVKIRTNETTEARKVLDSLGNPPLTTLNDIAEIVESAKRGELLTVDNFDTIQQYAASCMRLKKFLKRCEYLEVELSSYGYGIDDLELLRKEIELSIRNGRVDDNASKELRDIRRKIESISSNIRTKLENLLKSKKEYFTEGFISNRNGHFTLPVKREYKFQISGSVIDQSTSGATYFIEPSAVVKLKEELELLKIGEENEERKILYTLSALVYDFAPQILLNVDYIEKLDYIFAKGKLSEKLQAVPAQVTTDRRVIIKEGRHPLLNKNECVPLNFSIGNNVRGIVITGPNTGGKTVALKTVGLLSAMAGCGLHIPCKEAVISMNSQILCDVGDGQSISENLSTFSSHIKNVIAIIDKLDSETLVLMDELGSGTDPAEGMGIAISILEELKESGCTFVATTHYPEVKDYAARTDGIVNARMAFDKQSLKPLYQLEIGEAGESCAFYIAKQLGMPSHMLDRAYKATYKSKESAAKIPLENPFKSSVDNGNSGKTKYKKQKSSAIKKIVPPKSENERAKGFVIGDSVVVHPEKKLGIVFKTVDDKGNIGVMIQKKKVFVNYKRLQIKAKAADLYPDDYDFSIIFDSVEVRKARHVMGRKHQSGLEIEIDDTL